MSCDKMFGKVITPIGRKEAIEIADGEIQSETTGTTTAVWRLEGTTLVTASVNALWTATKDNAGTYNVYFEAGALKVQNKVGNNKVIKVGFYGV